MEILALSFYRLSEAISQHRVYELVANAAKRERIESNTQKNFKKGWR